MKLYLYYLKKSKTVLYAWTINKTYSEKFEEQRNMNLFKREVVSVENDIQFKLFSDDNGTSMLIEDVLYDGKNTVYIICTRYESSSIDAYIDGVWETIHNINNFISNEVFNVKDKYLNAILSLTNNITCSPDQEGSGELRINTFDLFLKLFENTFMGGE